MGKKNKKNNNGEIKFISKEMKKQTYRNEDVKLFVSAIVILIVMGICLVALFYFNGKFVTKDEFQDTTTTTTTTTTVAFDKSTILGEKTFKQSDKSYYVLFYDSKDTNYGAMYANLAYNYQGKTKLYNVDLGSSMNKKYYNPEGKENTKPTKESELVITKPTLIKIEKGKVTSYVSDRKEIINLLNEKATNK